MCRRMRSGADNGKLLRAIWMMLMEPIEDGQGAGARPRPYVKDMERAITALPRPSFRQLVEQHLDFGEIHGKKYRR